MYSKICKFVSNSFLKRNIITSEDQEVFEFGLETMIAKVFTVSILLLTGIILKRPIESLVYCFCLKYSRKQAGGYHANTYTTCNTLFIITFVVCILLSGVILISQQSNIIFIIIAVFVMSSIILLAPINNPNNPILSGDENRFFLQAIGINGSIIVVAIVLKLMHQDLWALIMCTLLASAIYMHIEIIKRREWRMKSIKMNVSEKISKLVMKNAKNTTKEASTFSFHQTKRPSSLNVKKD